jgi:hypothetical protein
MSTSIYYRYGSKKKGASSFLVSRILELYVQLVVLVAPNVKYSGDIYSTDRLLSIQYTISYHCQCQC